MNKRKMNKKKRGITIIDIVEVDKLLDIPINKNVKSGMCHGHEQFGNSNDEEAMQQAGYINIDKLKERINKSISHWKYIEKEMKKEKDKEAEKVAFISQGTLHNVLELLDGY